MSHRTPLKLQHRTVGFQQIPLGSGSSMQHERDMEWTWRGRVEAYCTIAQITSFLFLLG